VQDPFELGKFLLLTSIRSVLAANGIHAEWVAEDHMLTLISNLEASKRQPRQHHLVTCSEEVLWGQIEAQMYKAVGERLLTTIIKLLPDEGAKVVGKCVGMLVELQATEVIQLLEHPDQLLLKLDQAFRTMFPEELTDLRQEDDLNASPEQQEAMCSQSNEEQTEAAAHTALVEVQALGGVKEEEEEKSLPEPEDFDDLMKEFGEKDKATVVADIKSSKSEMFKTEDFEFVNKDKKMFVAAIKPSKSDSLFKGLKGLQLLMAAAFISFSMDVLPGQCCSEVFGFNIQQPGLNSFVQVAGVGNFHLPLSHHIFPSDLPWALAKSLGTASAHSPPSQQSGQVALKAGDGFDPPAPFPTPAWQNALNVSVDHAHPGAADSPECGISPDKPCKTIRYGTSRAMQNGIVLVTGGNQAYLGECYGSGIQIERSLTIIGIGTAVVDCQLTGRAFYFNCNAEGQVFQLEGLIIKNGLALNGGGVMANLAFYPPTDDFEWDLLVLHRCTFLNCTGSDSSVMGDRVTIRAFHCSFIGSNSSSGDALSVQFHLVDNDASAITVVDCNFTDTDGLSIYVENNDGPVMVENCTFSNTDKSATRNGLVIGWHANDLKSQVVGCTFTHTAGCSMWCIGDSQDSVLFIDRCNFIHAAGVAVAYQHSEGNDLLCIQNCKFDEFGGVAISALMDYECGAFKLENCSFFNSAGCSLSVPAEAGVITAEINNCSFFCDVTSVGCHGLSLDYHGWAASFNITISNSTFVGALDRKGNPGVLVSISGGSDVGSISSAHIIVEGCSFFTGGGLQVTTGLASTLAIYVIVYQCQFEENSAVHGADGGAASIFTGACKTAHILISTVQFTSNAASGNGGALSISSGAHTNATVIIKDARYTDNVAGGNGGALSISAHSHTVVVIENNSYAGNLAGGSGGGVSIVSGPNTSAAIYGSPFTSNVASGGEGGGAVSIVLPQDEPHNLNFVANANGSWVSIDYPPRGDPQVTPIDVPADFNKPCAGCNPQCGGTQCPMQQFANTSFPPVVPREGMYRSWGSISQFMLADCKYLSNSAKVSGGAVSAVGGGHGTILHCLFHNNSAVKLFGGGTSIGGTVRLSVANTSWLGNTCGQSGSQLYSTSGNSITLNTSTVALGCASRSASTACQPGIQGTQSGRVTWRDSSGMYCSPGFVLVNHAFEYNTSVADWKMEGVLDYMSLLNCSSSSSQKDCELYLNASCPCYFIANPKATVHPKVQVSALSYSCSACIVGQYNPEPAWLNNSNSSTIGNIGTCIACPPGQFQNLIGQASCQFCSAGRHQREPGQKLCEACARGQFQESANSTVCINCPPGKSQTDSGKPSCSACSAGQSQSLRGQPSCIPCPVGQFQHLSNATSCSPCPYGGSCSAGNATAAAGFWGEFTQTSQLQQQLHFYPCPPEYCCGDASTPCNSISSCAGSRSGILCGDCAKGFTQTVGSAACRASGDCKDAAWFMPVSVLLAMAYALFALKKSEWSNTDNNGSMPQVLPACLQFVPALFAAALQPVLYFYQMASVLPLQKSAPSLAMTAIAGIANMQLHTGGGGGFACPLSGLTTLQAIEFHYLIPIAVAVMLALGFVLKWKHTNIDRRLQQYQEAAMTVTVLAYSTVMSTTFQLLHCVNIGSESRLFLSATNKCGAWQAPFFVLAVVLLLPLVLVLLRRTGLAAHLHKKLAVKLSSCIPAAAAAQLQTPYARKYGHWEAVLALHRLVIVVVQTFTTNSAIAALLQVLICLIALVVHLLHHPFLIGATNHLQTALLGSLVVVALLNVPQAIMAANATPESIRTQHQISQFGSAASVVLMLPAFACAGLGVVTVVDFVRRGHGKGEEVASLAGVRAGERKHSSELLDFFHDDVEEEGNTEAGLVSDADERQSLSEPFLQ
jgi:hypothetical protein